MTLASERALARARSRSEDPSDHLEMRGESERFARLAALSGGEVSEIVRQYARCLVRSRQRSDASYWRGAARACRASLALAHEETWRLVSLPKALRESYPPPGRRLPPAQNGSRQFLHTV